MTEPTLLPEISLGGDGALIEDLTRRAEQATAPVPYMLGPASNILARVNRRDETLQTKNLEGWLPDPTRPRGATTLYDAGDFNAYVHRLATPSTTVWGNEERASFTAVFNDHASGYAAGWRDHTATLQLKNDPEWTAFLQRDGKYFSQLEFAEFLQDYGMLFAEPDGATLLEIATSFKAHRKAEFSSEVNLDTGDASFSYTEITTQKAQRAGQIDVPKEFIVGLSPFLGMPPVAMRARLRWDVSNGNLQIGFRLVRPDLVKREAFADIRQTIVDGLKGTPAGGDVTVLLGSPPQPVTPTS
jgi:uncharacterized protein YfdQ (DUF2303 family)